MTKTARQRKKVKSYQPRTTKRKHKNLRKAAAAGNNLIQQSWDKSATVQQNYARLGLVGNANWNNRQIDERMSGVPVEKREPIDFSSVTGEDMIVEKVTPPGETNVVEELMAKHGLNCTAMARDIKINVQQHTAKQLFKKIKTYLEKHAPAKLSALSAANDDLFN
jgi:hypothetical protein